MGEEAGRGGGGGEDVGADLPTLRPLLALLVAARLAAGGLDVGGEELLEGQRGAGGQQEEEQEAGVEGEHGAGEAGGD